MIPNIFGPPTDPTQYPGALPTPRLGGGMFAESGLGAISPHLGMLASAFGLDEMLLRKLAGPGFLRYGGSWDSPVNAANMMQNQWQAQLLSSSMSNVRATQDQYQEQMLTNTYRMLGRGDSSAEAARNAMSNPWNPMGMLASAMMAPHEFSTMRQEMQRTNMALGLVNMNAIADPAGGVSDATLRRIGFDNKESVYQEQNRRADAMRKLNDKFIGQYTEDTFSFGGLTAGGAGQVMTWMSRSGGINKDDMLKPGANTDEAAGRIVGRVKEMSRTVGVMQELFGGSIPEVIQKMENVFGAGAGNMDPGAMRSRLLQMKYTAYQTGMGMDQLASMTGAAQQYMMGLGASTGMAVGVAMDAALLGNVAGTGFKGDPRQFQEESLRMQAGAAASQQAKLSAGAYQLWLARTGEKDTADTRARFREEVKKSGGDITSLARLAGTDERSVLEMSETRTTRDFMEKNADFGANITMDTWFKIADQNLSVGLSDVTKRFNLGAKFFGDTSKLTMDEARKRIEASNLSAQDKQRAMAAVETAYANAAEPLTAQGLRTDKGETLDQWRQNFENMEREKVNIQARAQLDDTMSKKFAGRFGGRGIAEALRTADKDTGISMRDLIAQGLGLKDTSLLNMETYSDTVNALITGAGGEGTAAGARLGRMDLAVGELLRTGAPISEENKKKMQDLYSGKLSPEDAQKTLEDLYYGATEEGKAMKILKDTGKEEAYMDPAASVETKRSLKEQAAVDSAMKEAKLDETAKTRIEKEGAGKSATERAQMIRDSLTTEADRKAFDEKLAENKKTLGLDSNPMENLMGKLLEVLEKLVTALTGKDQPVAPKKPG